MKLVIPMAGSGTRFAQAGFSDIKPLIPVHGKPMIAWVLSMFPGHDDKDMLFICRQDHLDDTPLREALGALAPQAQIAAIGAHKDGPVRTLLDAASYLPDSEDMLVSYCDYFMQWSYPAFRRRLAEGACDGAVPCYTGFHPHLLTQNLYAGCRADAHGRMTAIREKHCFESDKLRGLHSAGLYYFRSGAQARHYLSRLAASDSRVNGEYYVSQAYALMLEDGLHIDVPLPIDYFCQWGTPEDLKDYYGWMEDVRLWKN